MSSTRRPHPPCAATTHTVVGVLIWLACATQARAQWPQFGPQWGAQGQGQGQQQGQSGGTAADNGQQRYQVEQWPPPLQQGGSLWQSQWGLQQQQQSTFPGVQTSNPEFRGFPSVVDRQGFGAYPNYPGFSPSTKIDPSMLPPVGALRPPGLWPSWLTLGRSDENARSRPDRFLLVRNSERVWYRAADEPVYVPLPFHDKVREVEAGAGVQVRTRTGEVTFILHDGATLRACGMLDIEVRIVSEAVAEFDLRDVYRAWVDAKKRPLHVRLPDTSTLEVSGAQVYFGRDGERVTVRNYGPQVATLRSPLGVIDVPRNRQVEVLMSPVPEDRVVTSLEVRGTVRARVEGRTLAADGGNEGGTVEWLGARLRLGANQSATVDALAGDTFPEYRPGASKDAGSVGAGTRAPVPAQPNHSP